MAAERNTVMIAVDGSDIAEQAVNWYLDHLHRSDYHLVLAHCMEPPIIYGSKELWDGVFAGRDHVGEAYAYDSLFHETKEQGNVIQTKFSQLLKNKKIPGSYVSVIGQNPEVWLVNKAEQEKPKLIVLGSRGLGALRRTVLGSVSDYVLHHAHCPVAVYHAPIKDEEESLDTYHD